MKNVLGTLAGLILASVTVYVFEKIGHALFPIPDSVNPYNMESIKNNIHLIPKGNMAFVALAHGMGILAGMFIAGFISKTSMIPTYIVGILMAAISIMYYFLIPSPTWFIIADLALILIGFVIGKKLAESKMES